MASVFLNVPMIIKLGKQVIFNGKFPADIGKVYY